MLMPDSTIATIIGIVLFSLCMVVIVIGVTVGVFFWVRKSFGSGAPSANAISAPATILRIWDTGATVNNDPIVGFQLQVTPPTGEPFEAECKQMISRLEIPMIQPGTQVTVAYDPAKPKKIKITGVNAPASVSASAPAQANIPGVQGQLTPAEIERKLRQIDEENQAILARGQSAQAEVVQYMDWNVKVNGENPAVTLQVKVLPPGSSPFMAQVSGVIAAASVPRFQPGRTIWVKYDPYDLTKVAVEHS